ncbi:IPT/TIG domain-containing protein [Mucilaginibacter sp.]|uniref:IPT/TIG domain-containing protein n=1 Tax=Mucilaginibacter sp. TaxID=1882438 RepID=UPI0035BC42A1
MFKVLFVLKRSRLVTTLLVLQVLALGCKKDNNPSENPANLPIITTMQYYSYNGIQYTDGPLYYNNSILNNLGVPNSVITINGHNFSQDYKESKVMFNDISSPAIWGDSTRVLVAIPDDLPAGPVKLTLLTNGKSIVHQTKFTAEAPNPQISGINVPAGMLGSRVIITGKDFSTSKTKTVVTVNGVAAVVDSASLTYVSFKVPSNTSSGKIALTTHGKTLTYNNDFKIVSSTFTTITNFGLKNISLDAAGNIYGTDDNKIVKVTPGGIGTTITRIGSDNNYFGKSGTVFGGTVADASGNVYFISPYQANQVGLVSYPDFALKLTKVLADGTSVAIAGGGFPSYVDGQGTSAKFNIPGQVVIDPISGNFYINDLWVIRKVTPAGVVSTVANSRPVAGVVTIPNLKVIGPMAVQSATGDLYTIDVVAGYVGKITPGGAISTFPFTFASGSAPVNSLVGAATLVADATGGFYFSIDSRLYQLKNGVATNIYANPTTGNIVSMTIDKAGDIYLSADNSIYKVKL